MNKKRLSVITTILLWASAASMAQNSILDKINSIKSQSDIYMWDEYTHPNPDSAIVNASRWVLIEVNVDREPKIPLEAVMPYMKHIKMQRGELTRAFAYMKRSDVELALGQSVPAYEPTPKHYEPTPTPYQPVANDDNTTTPDRIVSQPTAAYEPDAFIKQIQRYKNFWDVYNLLEHKRVEGVIAQFGALKDVDDYNSLDLILFDMQSQEVISVLSSADPSGNRINLTTGTLESLDNYPQDMLLALWYIRQIY